jgi:organic hydroperoxide reductase OsmC/OhrA
MKLKINSNKKILIAIIGISLCIFILYLLNIYSKKEGFIPSIVPVTYSQSTIKEYNDYINNPDYKSWKITAEDLGKIGVPENSVKQFISTGSWSWSPALINTLKQMFINQPDISSTKATDQIVQVQKVWPEQLFLLFTSGQFGANFTNVARTKNLTCNIDSTSKKSIGNSMYTLDASGNITTTAVDNAQLPTLIPGFNFLSSPCNPCNILNGNFDCPFAYPDSNGQTLFPGFLMEYAWGLSPSAPAPAPESSSNIMTSIPKIF